MSEQKSKENMVQKAVTVKREHIEKASRMDFELGRQDPVLGQTNFSGVVRDAVDALYKLYMEGEVDREEFFDEDGEPDRRR